MNVWLKLLLSLSLSGTLMSIVYLLLQKLFKTKLAPKMLYAIWILVLLRFIVPLSFEGSMLNQSQRFNYFENAPVNQVISSAFPLLTDYDQKSDPTSDEKTIPNVVGTSEALSTHQSPAYTLKLSTLFTSLWLLGALFFFIYHIRAYLRYMHHLKNRLIEPESDMKTLFESVKATNGLKQHAILLALDPLGETPMLIGLLFPKVVLPEDTTQLDKTTLSAIFTHELTHFKRHDLWLKWLTVFIASVHWFNPLMPWIQTEINRACELSCDEQVIKSMGIEERRQYGTLLLNTVRSPKHRIQAALYEDKKTMKRRLTQIVSPVKGSRKITLAIALVLLLMAFILGAYLGKTDKVPPELFIFPEAEAHKTAILSSYDWSYDTLFDTVKHSTSETHPTELYYATTNTLFGDAHQQLFIGTQVYKNDPTYAIEVQALEIYREGETVLYQVPNYELALDGIYTNLPDEDGSYIYYLNLVLDGKGPVTYGFKVVIGMPEYVMDQLDYSKTPYIGDASKVGALLGALPSPDPMYIQHYMAILSTQTPYALTAYYEPTPLVADSVSFEINNFEESDVEYTRKKNALALFYGVGNLDVIHFSYRSTASEGDLDMDAYTEHFTYTRDEIADYFGGIPETLEALSTILYRRP